MGCRCPMVSDYGRTEKGGEEEDGLCPNYNINTEERSYRNPSVSSFQFIDTLRTVTAGKIYVENERARLTRTLAEMREAEGDITEAATVLQELQVGLEMCKSAREYVSFRSPYRGRKAKNCF